MFIVWDIMCTDYGARNMGQSPLSIKPFMLTDHLEFEISFSAIFRIISDQAIVSGRGNTSTLNHHLSYIESPATNL